MDTDNRILLILDEDVDLDFRISPYKGKVERAMARLLREKDHLIPGTFFFDECERISDRETCRKGASAPICMERRYVAPGVFNPVIDGEPLDVVCVNL